MNVAAHPCATTPNACAPGAAAATGLSCMVQVGLPDGYGELWLC
jgi:hypothetical protein